MKQGQALIPPPALFHAHHPGVERHDHETH